MPSMYEMGHRQDKYVTFRMSDGDVPGRASKPGREEKSIWALVEILSQAPGRKPREGKSAGA